MTDLLLGFAGGIGALCAQQALVTYRRHRRRKAQRQEIAAVIDRAPLVRLAVSPPVVGFAEVFGERQRSRTPPA